MKSVKNALEEMRKEGLCSEETAQTLTMQNIRLQQQVMNVYEGYVMDEKQQYLPVETAQRLQFLKQAVDHGEKILETILEWLERPSVLRLCYSQNRSDAYHDLLIAKATGTLRDYREIFSDGRKELSRTSEERRKDVETGETVAVRMKDEKTIEDTLKKEKERRMRLYEKDVLITNKDERTERMRPLWDRYEIMLKEKIPEHKYHMMVTLLKDVEFLNCTHKTNVKTDDEIKRYDPVSDIAEDIYHDMEDLFAYREYASAEKVMNTWAQKLKTRIQQYESIIDKQLSRLRKKVLDGAPEQQIEKEFEFRNQETINTEMQRSIRTLSDIATGRTSKKELENLLLEGLKDARKVTYSIQESDKDPVDMASCEEDYTTNEYHNPKNPIEGTQSHLPELLSDNTVHLFTIHQQVDNHKKERVGLIIGYEAENSRGEKILVCEGIDINKEKVPTIHTQDIVSLAEEELEDWKQENKYDTVAMLLWNNDSGIEKHSQKKRKKFRPTNITITKNTRRIRVTEENILNGVRGEAHLENLPDKIEYYVIA